MLHTPKNHLPDGYPLPNEWESNRFEPIFERAFEIHNALLRAGLHPEPKPGSQFHEGSMVPVPGAGDYCDCYEKAYREFDFAPRFSALTSTVLIPTKRKIILDKFRCVQPSSSK